MKDRQERDHKKLPRRGEETRRNSTGPVEISPKDFKKKKREILRSHGVVKRAQKIMTLEKWALKYDTNESAAEALHQIVSDVFDEGWESGCSNEIFEDVCDRIPDREWLKFARLKLRLTEAEIRKIKETCEFTRGQKSLFLRNFRMAEQPREIAHAKST